MNEYIMTRLSNFFFIYSSCFLISQSLAVLPFCLKASLPKFGNMVKDESNV